MEKRETTEKKEKNRIKTFSLTEKEIALKKLAKKVKEENSAYYYHGCSPCCSEDTKVITLSGEKLISKVKDCDFVLTENNKFVKIVLVNKIPVLNHMVLEIKFKDKTVLKVSPDHPTGDGRLFKDLKVGDLVDEKEIINVKPVPYKYKYTYDILPDSTSGNYYANGVLIRSTLKVLKRDYKAKLKTA